MRRNLTVHLFYISLIAALLLWYHNSSENEVVNNKRFVLNRQILEKSNGNAMSHFEVLDNHLVVSTAIDFLSDDHHTAAPTTDDHNSTADDEHHATDDHSSAGGHSVSLFGSVSTISPMVGTLAMLFIVAFILCLETLFECLHAFTHETTFTHMVVRIENELMIVGCSAFIFKVLLNTVSFLDAEWTHALEFAELLIPIMSFCYCIIGFFLILMALKQCDLWSKAYHLKLIELIDDYISQSKSWVFRLSWKPLNRIISEMEFRIFHHLFCEMYKIQRDAFDFDEYVQKVFENFVMSIVEIRPVDWFIVCVVVLLNLARKKLHWDLYSCEAHDIDCDEESSLILFTETGAVVFLITCVFVVVSRNLELKIMSRRGVSSWRLYAAYLQNMEDQSNGGAEKRRLNVEELKMAVLSAKSKSMKIRREGNSTENFVSETVISAQVMLSKIKILPNFLSSKKTRAESPEAIEAIIKLARQGTMKKDMVLQVDTGAYVPANIMEGGSFDGGTPMSFGFSRKRATAPSNASSSGKSSFRNLFTGSSVTPTVTEPIVELQEEPSPPRQLVREGARSARYSIAPEEQLYDAASLAEGSNENASTNNNSMANMQLYHDLDDTSVINGANEFDLKTNGDGRQRGEAADEAKSDPDSDLSEPDEQENRHRAVAPLAVEEEEDEQEQGDVVHSRVMSFDETEEVTSKVSSKKLPPKAPVTASSHPSSHPPSPKVAAPVVNIAGSNKKKIYNPNRRRFPVYFRSAPQTADEDQAVGGAVRSKGATATGSFLRKQFTVIRKGLSGRIKEDGVSANASNVSNSSSVEQTGSDVRDVFWLSCPEIYFECVQLLIVIIALDLALWLTNFLSTAHTPLWRALSVLPGLLSAINYIYIVKTAALLRALYKVDFDVVLEVIEQTEGVRVLSDQLRSKVITRLAVNTDPHEELLTLYREIDRDGDNALSRAEFETFMNHMGINFSRKKWQVIYREIDRNYDNCISFQEFYLFLYPEHDVAMALEMKRLKVISKRVFHNAKMLPAKIFHLHPLKHAGSTTTTMRRDSISLPAQVAPVAVHADPQADSPV